MCLISWSTEFMCKTIKTCMLGNFRSLSLRANGWFWYVVKIKWNYFSSLNHNVIVLCELLMPCQLFSQKYSNFQEITKISKCLGSPRTLCHWYYTHRDILLLSIFSLSNYQHFFPSQPELLNEWPPLVRQKQQVSCGLCNQVVKHKLNSELPLLSLAYM